MNSIFIIAHAPLAQALRQCALHVFPECADALGAFDVLPDSTTEDTLAHARDALAGLRQRTGLAPVLVLADALGATPCNVARQLIDDQRLRLVAGINLPMLLRSLCYRDEPLDALAERAIAGGLAGIVQVAAASPKPDGALCP